MVFSASYPHITTDDSLMETVSHGSLDYPFHFYYENMDMFDFNCIDWHWHTELEFVHIESGTVTMWVGDQDFTLNEGDAIFINTKILHKFYSPCAASIPNFLFFAFLYLSRRQPYIQKICSACNKFINPLHHI